MIKNEAKVLDSKMVNAVREQIEHRAQWLYFLLTEAEKNGIDTGFAKNAIFNCGCMRRLKKEDLGRFREIYTEMFETMPPVFEQIAQVTDEELLLKMYYCPLVAGWKKVTQDEETIRRLCDIAMYGDRGMFSTDGLEFLLESTIAEGYECCTVRVMNTAGTSEPDKK